MADIICHEHPCLHLHYKKLICFCLRHVYSIVEVGGSTQTHVCILIACLYFHYIKLICLSLGHVYSMGGGRLHWDPCLHFNCMFVFTLYKADMLICLSLGHVYSMGGGRLHWDLCLHFNCMFVFTLYKADMSFSGTCVFHGMWEAPLRPMFAF